MWKRFQPGEGPSRGLLRDCENQWIVCSSRNMLFRHRTVCNTNMLCYLLIVHRNVWRVRQLPKMSTKFRGTQNSEKKPTSAFSFFSMFLARHQQKELFWKGLSTCNGTLVCKDIHPHWHAVWEKETLFKPCLNTQCSVIQTTTAKLRWQFYQLASSPLMT